LGDGSLDLNLLVLFFQVVNTGSISRAAVRLGIPKATLSRKLRQLEQQVGAVLLKRGPQRLEVTDIGRALHEHCERISSIAADASQVVSEMQSGVRGSIRVALPFGLANTSLSRGIVQFARRYPEVRIYAQVCNRWVDVSEESYDVAIHIGTVRNPDLPMRRLASMPRGFFAAPEYVARRGLPQTQADLHKHDCIAMESQIHDGLWRIPTEAGAAEPVSPYFTTTDIVLARETALAALGVAMLTQALAAEDVRAGRLVRVLPEIALPPVSISAVYLERRYLPVRIRAFIDMMAESISAAEPPRIA
jgi:DNA-binding transcriptional LysR family regulator